MHHNLHHTINMREFDHQDLLHSTHWIDYA